MLGINAQAALLLFCFVAMTTGCGGRGENSSQAQAGNSTQEFVNGQAVPPEPEARQNASTIAGVDSDRNGIRDDLDRVIAARWGTDQTLFVAAQEHAKALQKVLTNPESVELTNIYVKLAVCSTLSRRNDDSAIAKIMLDTIDRRRAYARAFAGVVLSKKECQ